MPSLHVLFGQVVRRLREEAGYSQESFADAIGVHRNYIGTVERGETNITLENIGRIARGLKQPIWMLLRELESSGAGQGPDAIAVRTRRESGVAAGWPHGAMGRVADRRAEVRERLVGLLEELSELEGAGGRKTRGRAKKKGK